MAHNVTCVACGRQFDANEGGSYNPKSRRYTCPNCTAQQYAAAVAAEAKKQKRRFIWKIIIGVLFIVSGFTAIGKYDGLTVALCFVIGIALCAWAFIPRRRKDKEDGEA